MLRCLLAELMHRPLGAMLTALVLAVAVAVPLVTTASLREHARSAEARAERRGAEAAERMRRIERDLRTITLGMGYNAVVVAPGQDLDRLRLDGIPDTDMAQADGEKLARSKPDTLNHLLPVLMRRVRLPGREVDIVLAGAGGETWISDPRTQAPLLRVIEAGTCVPSKVLAERLGLRVGDQIEVGDRRLTVAGLRAARGGLEDAMLWVALGDAQAVLAAPERINAIYALLCQCGDDAGGAALAQVRKILPEHRLAVFATTARARGEVLGLAAQAGGEAAAAERQAAADERAAMSRLALRLGVAVLVAALLTIACTASANAQARRAELAVLRAVGWSASRVAALVMGQAMLVGLAGGGLGVAVATISGAALPATLLLAALGGAPLLAMLAGFPAFLGAVRSEPDGLLRDL
jgi:hypothetical protein